LTELRDPRISDVTVTHVEVSPDMRSAKVHVSVMGDEAKQKLTLRGLQNASGFLQQKIAHRIDTRYTPRLQFVLDLGIKRSIEVSRILDEVLPRPAPVEEAEEELDSDWEPNGGVESDDVPSDSADPPDHDANESCGP
jgi:ribosome-binding factor A